MKREMKREKKKENENEMPRDLLLKEHAVPYSSF